MTRNITCYVYTDSQYVAEYLVTIGPRKGYTSPTIGDMDQLESQLEKKLHKSEKSLRRSANSSPYDLDVIVDHRGDTACPGHLQEQQDEYGAASLRHLR